MRLSRQWELTRLPGRIGRRRFAGSNVDYLERIPIPPRQTFNVGLTSAGNEQMLELFGHPVKNARYDKTGECTPPNNPKFVARLETRSVGPFRVTGIRPAIDSMTLVLDRVKAELPDLWEKLGSAGMHCARFTKIRQPDGSLKIGPNISNHTFGTAIDIKIDGTLDRQGDGKTLRGLLVLSAYFNAANWYWGAGFTTEDAMHFEVSKGLLSRWKTAGTI